MTTITIRFPDEVADGVRAESEAAGVSINQLVVEAVAEAIKRHRMQRALVSMARRRARMRAEGRITSDSVEMIRQLREGIGRRD